MVIRLAKHPKGFVLAFYPRSQPRHPSWFTFRVTRPYKSWNRRSVWVEWNADERRLGAAALDQEIYEWVVAVLNDWTDERAAIAAP